MGFKQSFIIFLFTPIALIIAIIAVMRGWKPATILEEQRLPKDGKNRFSYNGKEYLKTFGTYWELPSKKNK